MRFESVLTLKQLQSTVELVVGQDLPFAVDVETTGLNKRKEKVVGIGICFDKEYSVYVPVAHRYDQPFNGAEAIEVLRPMFEGKNKIYAYNASFDIGFLRTLGFDISWDNVSDVMLMAYVYAQYRSLKLSFVAKSEFDFKVWDYKEFMAEVGLVGRGKSHSIAEAKVGDVAWYCGRDALSTFWLQEKLYPKVYDRFIYKLESAITPCVSWMADNGVLIDKEFFAVEAERLGTKLAETDSLVKSMAKEASGDAFLEFNVASTKQVGDILFDVLKLASTKETKTGKRSTDEDALLDLKFEHPIVNNILVYRGIAKQVSSYLEDYCGDYVQDDGRIHASFNQSGAATGRFSCSDPNLQNIPNMDTWWIKKQDGTEEEVSANVRKGFVVPVGSWLVEFDYSQIEARLAAGYTQDVQLMTAFRDGVDFHTKTGSLIFKVPVSQVTKHQRRIGKTTNFSLIYGGGGSTLYGKLKKDMKTTISECKQYAKAYREGYNKMFSVADKTSDDGQRSGFITTIFGRIMRLFEFEDAEGYNSSDYESRKKKEQLVSRGRRQAYNGVIQGSAADIIKIAMLKIYRKFKELQWLTEVLLLMQVHDSLIFEVPGNRLLDVLKLVPELMLHKREGYPEIPASVKVGKTWGKMEEKGEKESVEDFYSRLTGEEVTKETAESRIFVLEFKDGALKSAKQVEEFKDLVTKNPGVNELVIRIGGKDKSMKSKTSLGMEAKEKIMTITGGIFYEKVV